MNAFEKKRIITFMMLESKRQKEMVVLNGGTSQSSVLSQMEATQLFEQFESFIEKVSYLPNDRQYSGIATELLYAAYNGIKPMEWYKKIKEIDRLIEFPTEEVDYYHIKMMYERLFIPFTVEKTFGGDGFELKIEPNEEAFHGDADLSYLFSPTGDMIRMWTEHIPPVYE